MIIYLCRHGHRDPGSDDLASPVKLSYRGQEQAASLSSFIFEVKPQILLSSPKYRCVQTALPTSKKTGLPINVWPLLCEHDSYGPINYSEAAIIDLGAFVERRRKLPDTPEREQLDFAYKRAMEALMQMRALNLDRIVAFAHDCFNSVFIWAWRNLGCLQEKDRYYQNECCVNVLEDGKEPQINMTAIKGF